MGQKIETGVMSTEIVAKMMVKLLIRRVAFVVADLMADLMMAVIVTIMSQIHQNHQIVWIDQAGMILMELSIIVNGMQIMINVENGETVAEMRVSLLMRLVALVAAESEM